MNDVARRNLRSRILEEWQRGLPLTERPFAVMAESLGVSESDVIACLRELQEGGVICRVGAVVRPNTLGASTLGAVKAPQSKIVPVAEIIAAEPGINHVYSRENDWNLWFVVTGPDRSYVCETLQRVERCSGLHVLDLRLERAFHIDLGFSLSEPAFLRTRKSRDWNDTEFRPTASDRELVHALTQGLPLVTRPFEEVAHRLGRDEEDIIARVSTLATDGLLPRIGVIVRHRALGWRSNAMAVWDVPAGDVERAGLKLAEAPGVNLCYLRTHHADDWPYNLYCMVHAKSRGEALSLLECAEAAAGLAGHRREVLFSLRCFKQTGAMLALPREAA